MLCLVFKLRASFLNICFAIENNAWLGLIFTELKIVTVLLIFDFVNVPRNDLLTVKFYELPEAECNSCCDWLSYIEIIIMS